jgi:hypothetical protein
MDRLVIVLAVLVAAASPALPADTVSTTVTVPLVVCPTTVGVPVSPETVPPTARVAPQAARLTMYSAISGFAQVLAPPNFLCQAIIGADGGASLTAWNPTSISETTARGGVSDMVIPACEGCMLSLACPFFADAEKTLNQVHGPTCLRSPRGQVVRRLNAYTVEFWDPAGEHAPFSERNSLVPSTTLYAVNGVVVYGTYPYKKYRPDVSFGAVCVLPASEHAACTAILNQFLASENKAFPRLAAA